MSKWGKKEQGKGQSISLKPVNNKVKRTVIL